MTIGACHWYHLTTVDRGPAWTAGRHVPEYGKEPSTPRLCVCRSVAGCIAARIYRNQAFVYRTETPRRANRPKDVWDAVMTGERWIVPPVNMIKVGVVPHGVINRLEATTIPRVLALGRASHYLRLQQLVEAMAAVDELNREWNNPAERRFVRLMAKNEEFVKHLKRIEYEPAESNQDRTAAPV